MKNVFLLKKVFVLFAIIALLGGVIAGCGGGTTEDPNGEPVSAESIVRSTASDAPNIDPAVGSDYSSEIGRASWRERV